MGRYKAHKFLRKKNFQDDPDLDSPAMRLILFNSAVRSGTAPPKYILEWLANSFEKYIEREGESDLGDLLKLGGQPFKEMTSQYEAAKDVHLLIQLGLSKNFAAERVIEKADARLYPDMESPESTRTIKNWYDTTFFDKTESLYKVEEKSYGLLGRFSPFKKYEPAKIRNLLESFPPASRSKIISQVERKRKNWKK
ncbi:MAG: hypothetical protein ACP5FP_05145 [Desulfuromonadaceae bacterium]